MDDRLIKNDVIFDSKADAVPFNYRISYKVSLICLIIGKCCGKKGCSATKLQVINTATRSSKSRMELLDLTLIRFDPAISRAINYALADNLIYRQANGLLRLSEKGKELVEKIYEDVELMTVEKGFFCELSDKLTEDIIEIIAHNWRVNNA